ncbi:hypothetical protein DFH29DRAFT_1044782 [Suillus ampliporus]|nr:hypothetical protein DFH29DRAFT_1044782 [Suillus ampliporus]
MGETPHTSSCSSSSILSSTSTNSSALCPHPASSILIQTMYDMLDPQNRKMPTLQERKVDLVWTEEQWQYAEHAVKMDSMDELVQYLKGLYVDGIKSLSNTYIFIPNSLIRGHQLELRNNDETLMAYICGTMPSSIRDSLLQQLLLAFEDEDLLVDKDTSQDSDNSFEAIHFSGYNRHATRFMPYVSVETALNQDLYELVKVIFGDLFQWIQNNLQEYLPEEYEILEASARILLGNHHSPVLPFLSLVFNINIVTKGHRDGKDKHFCLVLPIGVFVGGELVMMETGLVVEVLQGDFIIFPSAKITHFNLHYQGRRASVVLHTDKAMDLWESPALLLQTSEEWLLVFSASMSGFTIPPLLKMKHNINNEGQDNHAALNAKIAHLESQLKSKDDNSKAKSKANSKAAQDHLDRVKQASRKRTQDMLAAEDDKQQEDDDDQDDSHVALSHKRVRQLSDTLDDEEEELGRLMQDGMEKQAKTGERERGNGHVTEDDDEEDDDDHDDHDDVVRGVLKSHIMDEMMVEGSDNDSQPPLDGCFIEEEKPFQFVPEVDAVGDVEALKTHLEELKLDHDAKEQAITYVWGACAQLRGELVSKARHKTSSSYNIPGNMSPSALAETIQWILKNDAFLYDKLDLVNKMFDRKSLFCNQLLKDLCITQWFGAKGEALRFPDAFKQVPDCILALIATAIECSLNTWLRGVRSQVKFTDAQFKNRYAHYMKKLKGLSKSCPTWLKQFKRDLYLKACKESGHDLLALQGFSDAEDDLMDLESMEQDAIARLGATDAGDNPEAVNDDDTTTEAVA